MTMCNVLILCSTAMQQLQQLNPDIRYNFTDKFIVQ